MRGGIPESSGGTRSGLCQQEEESGHQVERGWRQVTALSSLVHPSHESGNTVGTLGSAAEDLLETCVSL